VEAALSRAIALLAHGLHGHLEWASEQLFPDTAEAEYLDQWAKVWGISRKQAAAAAGAVILTGTDTTVAPAGTQLRTPEGALVATDADATITGGTATVAVTAVVPGAGGNAPEGAPLTLVSTVPGINGTATAGAGGIAGGADPETDAALRAMVLDRIQAPPAGGTAGDYERWALAVAGVTRAWVRPQWDGPGSVGVLFVLDDDPVNIIPNQAKVDEVQAYIHERRPVTARALAVAPVALTVDLTIELVPNTVAVQTAVENSLADLFTREAEPGGVITLSQIAEAISTSPGEVSHTLVAPASDIAPTPIQLPILGTVTFQ
jgi:uncharacterized phage protein gp47/JayE